MQKTLKGEKGVVVTEERKSCEKSAGAKISYIPPIPSPPRVFSSSYFYNKESVKTRIYSVVETV
jgi:hypothetical protein